MVEVLIEEMFRSNWKPTKLDYKRAVVVDAEKERKRKKNERENLFRVKRKKCLQKSLTGVGIVRDVR